MKISIITVSYNSETTIRDTIESVLCQTYNNIEYIAVDGGSTDDTMNIVQEYGNRIRKVISEPDNGLYDAMNKGFAESTGAFVGVLNSDDIFVCRNAVQDLADFLHKNPTLDGVYADLVFVQRNNTSTVTRFYSSRMFSARTIRFGIMCPHPTFYAKKALFEKWGGFDISFPIAADFELITRFITQGARFGRLNKTLVKMREGGISTSGFIQRIKQNIELVRACKKNGIYTNLLLISVKIPYKLLGYFAKEKRIKN